MLQITDHQVKNYSEILVNQALEEYLRDNVIVCTCQRCLADIMALALNCLPARYYVTSLGEVIIKSQSEDLAEQVRLMSIVAHAVQQVGAKPSHELSKPITETEEVKKQSQSAR
ncbi:Late competence development protein ComFB [Desulfosporosinus acidiphilus SJ4]|uniref:Late competence development protein ComFB n=1 Tax=Desulfosporosinus acidiphilus (strain DSM 22704 / JCM 16185 / SJ4) TaxID=646529 RepID=I4DC42_DESAJ|nr:late competence development ComFB family protein [Desulfosporosinus acidiphilus]AFM43366.1 Late competence development protein ComFB [Desulfosporosinus acidiphilus SJ4]